MSGGGPRRGRDPRKSIRPIVFFCSSVSPAGRSVALPAIPLCQKTEEREPASAANPPSVPCARARARSYCHSDALGLCSGSSHESRARRPIPPNEPPRLSEGRPPLGLNRPADGVQDLHDLLLGVHVPVPVLFAVTELLSVLDEHLEPPRRRGGAIPLDLDVLRWRWRWRWRMASASLTATQHKQRGDPFLWGFWRETRRSMKASTGPGKGVRTQGARAGLKGRLPSLASAFLPRRGDPQPRSDGVRRESDWVFVVGKGRRVPTAEGNLARMALHMALYLLKYPQAPQYVIFNFTMTVPCPVPLFRSLAL